MPTLTTDWQNLGSSGWAGISNANMTLQGRYTSQSTNSNSTACEFRVVTGGSTSWRTYTGSASYKGSYSDSFNIATAPSYVAPGSVLMSISKTVKHSDDGTKSLSLGAEGYIVLNDGTHTFNIGEVSITLPRINRISPILSFSGNDVEGTFSSTFTQYVSSYTQKLRISISSGATLQTFDNYSSGSAVSLNSSAISAIQTYMNNNHTNKVTLGAVIETWNGSTKIGESSEIKNVCSFSNANPTISNTETETDANVITYYGTGASTVVQNVSKVEVEVTATALKGASVSSVVITHNDVSYPTTLSSGKYVAIIPISSASFTISVTDNRGNSSSKTVTKTMVNYMAVDFINITIKRVNSTSSNIRFDVDATYYQETFNSTPNEVHLYYQLGSATPVEIPKKDTQQEIDGYEIDLTNHKLILNNYVVNNLLVYTTAGQFTLYIEDLLTTDTEGGTKAYVTKGVPTFDAGDTDVQINGKLYIADTDRTNAKEIRDLIYPVGSIYISVVDDTSQKVHDRFGGTWVAFATGRTLIGYDANDTDFNTVEGVGGNKTHTHDFSVRGRKSYDSNDWGLHIIGTGGSEKSPNQDYTTKNGDSLQPYIVVYMWKRTE